jgi:maltose/moltooligosaccharide transporter
MRKTQVLAYLGCSFSVGVFNAFNNFTLALWLAGLTSSYLLIGLLGNSRSFEGAIVSPLAGAWSDRTWAGWLGRRRPFILVGGLLSAAVVALTPSIGHYAGAVLPAGWPPELVRLAPSVVAIFLFTLMFNLMDDVHKALLPDVSHGPERNRLSSLSVVVDMAGQVAILALGALLWRDGVPDTAFVVAGGLIAVGVMVTVVGVREPAPAALVEDQVPEAPLPVRSGTRTAYRAAIIFGVVWFLYWSGVSAVLPLISLYTRDILLATTGEAQLLPALLLLSTTVMAVPMGRLGTRFGRRRVLTAGFGIMALAALAGLVVTTKEQGAVVFLVAGVGNAACMVLAIPLLAELVPAHHIGRATGLLAGAGSIAAPVASLSAGVLSDAFGLRAIFGLMAAMTLLAMGLMTFSTPQAGNLSLPQTRVPSPPDI